jgi:hypothetical protein
MTAVRFIDFPLCVPVAVKMQTVFLFA